MLGGTFQLFSFRQNVTVPLVHMPLHVPLIYDRSYRAEPRMAQVQSVLGSRGVIAAERASLSMATTCFGSLSQYGRQPRKPQRVMRNLQQTMHSQEYMDQRLLLSGKGTSTKSWEPMPPAVIERFTKAQLLSTLPAFLSISLNF